jgi:hypothetical protein
MGNATGQTGKGPRGTTIAAMAVLSLTLVSPAHAKDDEAENAYVAKLKACQAETDATARLACFDATSAEIVGATETGDLRIVDREEVRKTRRSLFGLNLPDFGIFGKRDKDGKDEDEIEELETKVAAVSGSFSTGFTIRTTEGAVWRIDDVPRRMLDPKVGDTMLIKNGALTSYFVRINGQGGVKAVRIR